MRITHTIVVMFVGSFLIQYFLMSPITTYSRSDITNNISKVYMSTIMGLFMVFLEIMMHDNQYNVLSVNSYVILASLLGLFIYLYRKQVAVNDKQYLEEMIEHHSMALLTSNRILEKTSDYNVAKIAKNIIQKQEDEIREMRDVINRIEKK